MNVTFALLLLALLSLAGCGSNDPAAERVGEAPAHLPFEGVRLRLLVVDDRELAEAIGRLRGEWRGATGAELEIIQTTESGLLDATALDADAAIYPANDLGLLVENDWLLPLAQQSLAGRETDWPDIFEADKTHDACWGGEVYGIPFGSPVFVCWYRPDLLKMLGRAPPETWRQYQELAELLADRAALGDAVPADQRAWSATAEPLAEGWAGLTLLARAAAYAKHRNHYSALFDMRTMEPLVASPPFVRALDELVASAKLGPADAAELTPQRAMQAFAAGECGLALAWPEPRRADSSNSERPSDSKASGSEASGSEASGSEVAGSEVAGNSGGEAVAHGEAMLACVELPGAEDVYNSQTREWEMRRPDEPPRPPLLGIAGRVGSVAKSSEHADAAVHLLGWLAGPRWSARVSAASRATALFRQSQVANSQQWVAPSLVSAAAGYAETVERSLNAAEFLGAPRLPGRRGYLAALDRAVRSAVAGTASSEEALTAAADEWRELTKEMGLKRQQAAYRRSLGLP
jgi:multiple sugar transport system substrate-binding protein